MPDETRDETPETSHHTGEGAFVAPRRHPAPAITCPDGAVAPSPGAEDQQDGTEALRASLAGSGEQHLSVIGKYLVTKVYDCTCGADLDASLGAHEEHCGWEPVGTVEDPQSTRRRDAPMTDTDHAELEAERDTLRSASNPEAKVVEQPENSSSQPCSSRSDMPDLWWSPTIGLLERERGLNWIILEGRESLRHRMNSGPDSDPPMPADAIRLHPVDPEQGSWTVIPVDGRPQSVPIIVADGWHLLLWLHAEAVHHLTEEQAASRWLYTRVAQALGPQWSSTAPWHRLAAAVASVVAERDDLRDRLHLMESGYDRTAAACSRAVGQLDSLQARIDEAVRWIDEPQDLTEAGRLHQIRATLTGGAE